MKTLVLVGSGEFTPAMTDTDKYLIGRIIKNSAPPKFSGAREKIKVAVIPTASVPDGRQKKWITGGIKHFKKLETKPFGLNIVNRREANNSRLLKKLATADLIYFSGGHPGFLYKTFKNTIAWEIIENLFFKGTVLAGASAGAMIMGSYLLANAQETFDREIKPRWIKGLNLIPYTIFPHFDWVQINKPALFKKVLNSAPDVVKNSWMGIDEDTAIIISEKNKVRVIGKGKVTFNNPKNQQLLNEMRTS